jgi:iron complex outermembrane recepter protein
MTHARLFVAAALFASASAVADDTYRLSIPAQPLTKSLQVFAQQSGLTVVHYAQITEDKTAPALEGAYTSADALGKLLANSGLRFSYVNARTIAIRPATSASSDTSARPIGAQQDDKSFWTNVRLAQLDGGAPLAVSEASTPESSGAELEEIVVTAQKRKERLIDTPQSVSVLSADAIAKIGATQFRDFANTVPGLSFTTAGAGYTQVSLRGVTAGFDLTPTVGIYVDDVPFGSSSGFAQGAQLALDVGLFDIERIEVLRGPQGTLYGASTMGGLVKYVSKQPDASTFGVEAQTGVSGTKQGAISYNGAAAINAPLATDKAALRASGFYSRDGGYVDNVTLNQDDVNQSDVYGGRIDLLLTPIDGLSVRLGAFLQNIERGGQATSDFTFAGQPETASLEQNRRVAEPFEQRFRLASATVAYDFGPATLTSISSHQSVRTEMAIDFSRQFLPILAQFFGLNYGAVGFPQDLETRKLTQELRLASNNSGTLEWIVGGFYTHEKSDNVQEFVPLDLAGQPAPRDLYAYSGPTRFEEYALFGDLTWHLTDRFDVSGGVRRARNEQSFTQFGSGRLIGSAPTRRSEENVSTYLANARYRFGDRATGYVRYATGYRPGGPNFVANDPTTGLPVAAPTFEADRLKSYEIGYKSETADRRFSVDTAVYYIDWGNIQINAVRGGFAVIANANAGAEVRGVELTVAARPIEPFTLAGAFAWQDAKMSNTDLDLGALDGERLPNVPRFTATLTGDYALPFGIFRPTIGATLRHVSNRMASFNASPGSPQYRVPEYSTFDVRTGFAVGSVDLQLYIHNISDERGQLSVATNRGPAQVSLLQPRTVGITATTRF